MMIIAKNVSGMVHWVAILQVQRGEEMKIESYICDRCGEEIKDNIFILTPDCVDKKDGHTLVGMSDDISDELYALMRDRHMCFECTKETLRMIYAHS